MRSAAIGIGERDGMRRRMNDLPLHCLVMRVDALNFQQMTGNQEIQKLQGYLRNKLTIKKKHSIDKLGIQTRHSEVY